jgi:hypothetical protein
MPSWIRRANGHQLSYLRQLCYRATLGQSNILLNIHLNRIDDVGFVALKRRSLQPTEEMSLYSRFQVNRTIVEELLIVEQ